MFGNKNNHNNDRDHRNNDRKRSRSPDAADPPVRQRTPRPSEESSPPQLGPPSPDILHLPHEVWNHMFTCLVPGDVVLQIFPEGPVRPTRMGVWTDERISQKSRFAVESGVMEEYPGGTMIETQSLVPGGPRQRGFTWGQNHPHIVAAHRSNQLDVWQGGQPPLVKSEYRQPGNAQPDQLIRKVLHTCRTFQHLTMGCIIQDRSAVIIVAPGIPKFEDLSTWHKQYATQSKILVLSHEPVNEHIHGWDTFIARAGGFDTIYLPGRKMDVNFRLSQWHGELIHPAVGLGSLEANSVALRALSDQLPYEFFVHRGRSTEVVRECHIENRLEYGRLFVAYLARKISRDRKPMYVMGATSDVFWTVVSTWRQLHTNILEPYRRHEARMQPNISRSRLAADTLPAFTNGPVYSQWTPAERAVYAQDAIDKFRAWYTGRSAVSLPFSQYLDGADHQYYRMKL